MKEPNTDSEYIEALDKIDCELIDHDVDSFSVRNRATGGQTRLDAQDYSSALMEAWHLMKP